MSDSVNKLVQQVKDHAVEHYEQNGWDFLIECHTDEEIAEAIGKASTLRGAIWKVRKAFALDLHHEMRESAKNESF